jgi:class 3 adenylate cyclase
MFLTGTPAEVEVERVLATVLMTDIVGSTERAEDIGDKAWRDLLDAHNNAVRKEFARFRGHEVKSLGDGFLATFDGPARAIRCAVAITDAVKRLGIKVRAGLHTGEVELLDDDVRGIAFTWPRASRRSPGRARFWSRGPFAISWQAQAFASPSAEATP